MQLVERPTGIDPGREVKWGGGGGAARSRTHHRARSCSMCGTNLTPHDTSLFPVLGPGRDLFFPPSSFFEALPLLLVYTEIIDIFRVPL